MNLEEIKEDRRHCYAGVDYELEELVDWLIAEVDLLRKGKAELIESVRFDTIEIIDQLRTEVERLKIQSEELCHVLAVVLTISDRKHDAWDRAKAVLAKAREVDL